MSVERVKMGTFPSFFIENYSWLTFSSAILSTVFNFARIVATTKQNVLPKWLPMSREIFLLISLWQQTERVRTEQWQTLSSASEKVQGYFKTVYSVELGFNQKQPLSSGDEPKDWSLQIILVGKKLGRGGANFSIESFSGIIKGQLNPNHQEI